MELRTRRAIATELIKLVHRCIVDKCPRFDECLSDLSICIYRQPRTVERDAWEIWQFVLHAREKAGEGAFLEMREPYNEEKLLEILKLCAEDLAADYKLVGDKVTFTIK